MKCKYKEAKESCMCKECIKRRKQEQKWADIHLNAVASSLAVSYLVEQYRKNKQSPPIKKRGRTTHKRRKNSKLN